MVREAEIIGYGRQAVGRVTAGGPQCCGDQGEHVAFLYDLARSMGVV